MVLVITSSKLLLLVNLVVFLRELKVVAYFVGHIGSGREKVGVDCKVHVVEEIHRRATWCLRKLQFYRRMFLLLNSKQLGFSLDIATK